MMMIHHDGYIARVEIDDEDDVLFGEVVNVTGVITFYGSRSTSSRPSFGKSIEFYEQLCRKHEIAQNEALRFRKDSHRGA